MSDHDRAMAHLRRFGLKEPADEELPELEPISLHEGGPKDGRDKRLAQGGRTEGGAVPPASPRVHRIAPALLPLPVRISQSDPCQILDHLGRQVAVVDQHREMPDPAAVAIAAMIVAAVNALGEEGR